MAAQSEAVCVFLGEALARYHFGAEHPFGPQRHDAFCDRLTAAGLISQLCVCQPESASADDIACFHDIGYIDKVRTLSKTGQGYLDDGDTPARTGLYEASLTVVGTVLAAVRRIMTEQCRRAFVPIAGLHHARPERAAGFCVFNDCAIAIEVLRRKYQLPHILYLDIDAHHGDGVFYAYESNPHVWIADIHEDGLYLYPGSGKNEEQGCGRARGTKLNVALAPGAGDDEFMRNWPAVQRFIEEVEPDFIIMQCGADGLAGDPITHLAYSPAVHRYAARQLCRVADRYCHGRLLALGGGGYRLDNLARAWTAVVDSMAAG